MVILALVSLVSAMVVMRLQAPYRMARFRDAVQRLMLFDQQARSHARRFGRATELVCDLAKNQISLEAVPAENTSLMRLALPAGIRLERVRTREGHTEAGEARLAIDEDGQTPSYALWLKGPERSEEGLFFAGLTGQVTKLKAESDEEPLFALLGPARSNAP